MKYKQFFCLFHDLKLCFCLEKAFLNQEYLKKIENSVKEWYCLIGLFYER